MSGRNKWLNRVLVFLPAFPVPCYNILVSEIALFHGEVKMKLISLIFCCVVLTASFGVVRGQKLSGYEKFRDKACETFLETSKKVNEEYRLGDYSRWDFSQDTGKLIFSDDGVQKVIATVQVAGSWSNISSTWMWSWHNKSILDPLKVEIGKVRKFGLEKKYAELTDAVWASDPEYAWTMTAVAGQILGAKTSYRAPMDTGYLYLLVFDLKLVANK